MDNGNLLLIFSEVLPDIHCFFKLQPIGGHAAHDRWYSRRKNIYTVFLNEPLYQLYFARAPLASQNDN